MSENKAVRSADDLNVIESRVDIILSISCFDSRKRVLIVTYKSGSNFIASLSFSSPNFIAALHQFLLILLTIDFVVC